MGNEIHSINVGGTVYNIKDTTYTNATTSKPGLMGSGDKYKLDNLSIGDIKTGSFNKAGTVSAVTRMQYNTTRACRSAFLPNDCIKIEHSNDDGKTWKDVTNNYSNRNGLFSMNREFSLYLCKDSSGKINIHSQDRITMIPSDRYTSIDMFYCWFSTGGHSCSVSLEMSTLGQKDKFSTIVSDIPVSGWSGNNEIVFPYKTFGGGSHQSYNNYSFRMTFKTISLTEYEEYKTNIPSVTDIRLYGPDCWKQSNNMMATDNIYSYDSNQNVEFPGVVEAKLKMVAPAHVSSPKWLATVDDNNNIGYATSAEVRAAIGAASSNNDYLSKTDGGIINNSIRVNGVIRAYEYGSSSNNAAITMDKVGSESYGIGGNGKSMEVQYGQVTSVDNGNWSSSQNIKHMFKGELYVNDKNVITEINAKSKVSVSYDSSSTTLSIDII